ncbi:signal peptidase I [Edaphobacter aggregans]|uniref:signal peptidase I n=1 Tax=Edaphobacter aggregans TaxID=570835 RepID=UPI0009FD7B4B|nr:signal peptidase I [Edaphobacter aggregans]
MSGPALTSAPIHEPAKPLAGSVLVEGRPTPPPPTPEPPRAHHPHKPGILPAVQSLVTIIVIAVFVVTFTVQPFRIPSGSMEPTLLVGDFLLVDKQPPTDTVFLPPASIHRGDVIVFHYPLDPSVHLVKRVVGIPGDHIRLRGGHVLVNGLSLTEPYAIYRPAGRDNYRDNFPRLQSADPEIDSRWWIRMRKLIDNGELIVPDGNYFVLGDNRNDSEDSRYWGFVPAENIVGRPLLVYFSLRQGADDNDLLALPHSPQPSPTSPTGLSFARWDRTLHVIH